MIDRNGRGRCCFAFFELDIDVLQTISHGKPLQYLMFELEIAMGDAVMYHRRCMIHSARRVSRDAVCSFESKI